MFNVVGHMTLIEGYDWLLYPCLEQAIKGVQ